MKNPLTLGIVLTAAALAGANAATLFSYDSSNDYVATAQTFQNPDGSAWASGNRAFSQTTPLSPASGYTGPSFIGGFSSPTLNGSTVIFIAPGASGSGVLNNFSTSGDTTRLGLTNNSGAAASFNWLLGSTFASINVDSTFSASLSENKSSGGTASVRLALYVGTQWYVSDNAVAISTTGVNNASFTNVQSFTWALYDPATNLAYSTAGGLTPALNNVTAFGFLNSYSIGNSGSRSIGFLTMDVEVAAVPEPGTAGMSALGVVVMGMAGIGKRFIRPKGRSAV